jgi:hypothetical protein
LFDIDKIKKNVTLLDNIGYSNMKPDNRIKIIFDFIMLILLIMVYGVSATGITFHEIAGMIIFIMFFIHLAYNDKWIINVTKRMFDKTFSLKLRFMNIVDMLLLLMFLSVGISGVMISKVLFNIGIVYIWRYVHIFSSGFSVILLGIHIGLHGKMIINAIKNMIHIHNGICKTFSIIVFVIIISVGIYGIIISNGDNDTMKNEIRNISILKHFEEIFLINRSRGDGEENRNNEKKSSHRNKMSNESHEEDRFNIYSVIIISAGYLSIILLCSIMTYCIENKMELKINKSKTYCA